MCWAVCAILNGLRLKNTLRAAAEPLVYWSMPEGVGGAALWYLEEARRLLIEFFTEQNLKALGVDTRKYGADYVYEAGLTVRTAMDPVQQEAAGAALRRGLEELDKRQGWRGPLQKLDPTAQQAFIQASAFTPLDLAGNGWVKALVTGVEAREARVTLGRGYSGVIPVAQMSWARKPNPKVAGIYAPAVKDVRQVLSPGDVVWVSAADLTRAGKDAKGRKTQISEPFDPSQVQKGAPVTLRLQQEPVVQGALASVEARNGDVVALIGGYQFGDSHFNRATQARRQPAPASNPWSTPPLWIMALRPPPPCWTRPSSMSILIPTKSGGLPTTSTTTRASCPCTRPWRFRAIPVPCGWRNRWA